MPDLFQYRSPWVGVDVSQPEVNLDPGATPYSDNFDYVLGELRTRPKFVAQSLTASSEVVIAVGRFLDIAGIYRDYMLTTTDLRDFSIKTGTIASHGSLFTPTNVNFDYPVIPVVYNGILYFPSGNALYSWNGTVAGNPASAYAGGVFVNKLASHVILLYTKEGGTNYPQRVRWSASGLPLIWDPMVNTNAGFVDIDTPDVVTGFVPMGTIGWVMQASKITQMIPTGNGISPFAFYDLTSAPQGVGCAWPWSLASYGSFCIFASTDDIYMGTLQGLSPIGGAARAAIFADITANISVSQSPWSAPRPYIIGSITTGIRIGFTSANARFDMRNPLYILQIPVVDNNTGGYTSNILWVFDTYNKTWLRWTGIDCYTSYLTCFNGTSVYSGLAARQ